MSTKMNGKHGTAPSVLARLMGLDELPFQQPIKKQKRQRVLSDNYLRKVACIGVRERRSSNDHHSFRCSAEEEKEFKGVFEVIELLERVSCSDLSGEKGKVDLRLSELEVPSRCVGFSNSMLLCALGRVSTETCSRDPDYFSIVPKLKSNFEECPSHRKGKGLHSHHKGKNLAKEMKSVRKWSSSSAEVEKRQMMHDINSISLDPPVSGLGGVDDHAKESEMMMFSSIKFSDVKNGYRSSIYHPGRSYMAGEAKKQISERWRMTEEFQDGLDSGGRGRGSGRSRTLGEMLAMSDHDSKPEHSYDELDEPKLGNRINPNDKYANLQRHDCLCMTMKPRFPVNWASQNSRKQNKHLIDGNYINQNKMKNGIEKSNLSGQNSVVSKLSWHNVLVSSNHATQEPALMQKDQKNKIKDGHQSEQNSVASKCIAGHMVADENMVLHLSSGNHNEHNLNSVDCILSVKDDSDSNSCVTEISSQQLGASPWLEVSEEGSVSSQYHATDHDSLAESEAACQLSPVSVLEGFEEEISSCSDFSKSVDAGLHCARLQLENLKSRSLEEDSEGPGMIVSSDDDSEEESLGGYKKNEDPLVSFRVEEGRDFSYMVDVLTAAGLRISNNMGFEVWHSPECPISLTVFHTVEKTYGEQASWKRSERRLFFDRINLGLVEILQTCLSIPFQPKSVVSFRQSPEVNEEELWTLLVNQEKESQKRLGNDDGWLVLGNDVTVITREIENCLIDELTAEVVSQESFQ